MYGCHSILDTGRVVAGAAKGAIQRDGDIDIINVLIGDIKGQISVTFKRS